MPIYKSLYPDIVVPQVDMFSFLFDRNDKGFKDDQVIYIDPDNKRQLTYSQIKTQAIEFGSGLKSLWRWKKGDVLAMYTPNQIDTPPVTWGCHWAGGVVTPANPTYTAKELAFQLKDSGAKALVTYADLLPIATKAAEEVGLPKDRIVLLGDKKVQGYTHWRSIKEVSQTVKWRKTKVNPKTDLAFIVYSSGTTGTPKGVMISHTNVITNICQFTAVEKGFCQPDRDTIIAFLPFFHIYGLTCIMHYALYLGIRTVVMPRFDLEKYLNNIQTYKVTYAFTVPPVVLLMAKHPLVSKYDLSSLRVVSCGAAPLSTELTEEFARRLPGIPIKQGYGMSEASPVTHAGTAADWPNHKGSAGRLVPNMEIKFVDEHGNEVERGKTGEIWVRGDNVMLGYLNNPKATKESITPDGFYKTGDIGHETEEGILYITDRLKELIKYKGFQVPPAELEGVLLSHPQIDDVCVVGVEDKSEATEVPRAYVVLKGKNKEGSEEIAKEIIKYVEDRVAQHKRLRGGVRFIEEVPKSVSGKILRRVLKEKVKEEEKEKELKVKAKL